mmetsp:Transcript_5315/g.8955  ORF Transcript_5315/g.8955 Transcript_5315/m.8955 type:complete len:247 (+) Transcript_5315:374-1114(+)
MSIADELEGEVDVSAGDESLSSDVVHGLLEAKLSVVRPDSLEVSLVGHVGGDLVGVDEVLHLDHLGSHLVQGLVLLLEGDSALLSGGVDSEDESLVLVGLGEGVEDLIGVVEMSFVPEPSGLRHLVVEESGAVATSGLLKSDPLEGVGLLSLSEELLGGVLGLELNHGLVPGASGVGVDLPAVHLVGGGPVGHLEALEEGSGSSVEGNVSHSLEKGFGVEVLGVDVEHHVGLLVELVTIEVLDSDS